MKKILLVLIVFSIFATGCGLPTYAVKTAMTTDISKCDTIVIGTTTKVEVEKLLKEKKPVSVKRSGESTIATYRSGYFTAKVTYKDNIVTDYECSKD